MKIEVRIRDDKERGLFAIQNIKKGEYVCVLPIDYICLDQKWYTLQEQTNKVSFRYGIRCDFVHGSSRGTELTKFENFVKNKSTICILKRHRTEIMGISNFNRLEGDFLGHMINDYVTMSMFSEFIYKKISKDHENITVTTDLELFKVDTEHRLGLKLYASKNIKKDQELYFSYGVDYWDKYSNEKNEIESLNFVKNLKNIISSN